MKMRRHFVLFIFLLLTTAFTREIAPCELDCEPSEDTPRPALTQTNPAAGWSVIETGTDDNPLAAFGRRPIDEPRIIPFAGNYMDAERAGPHFGIDYTYPESFLNNIPQPIHPIGPGIVTAVHTCPTCWANATGRWGQMRTGTIEAVNNFGFGAVVIIEHPYNEFVSFYSLYAHLREINVHVGQRVTPDDPLALLGGSGDTAAPHVHMEIRFGLPGEFWGANFNKLATVRRWLELRHDTPVFLLYEEHHIPFTRLLDRWVEEEYPLQPRD